MTYRDDLQAARMRREALNRELDQVRDRMDEYEELVRQKQALEQELAQCARDMDDARARVELPLLHQVRLASPCKERWDDMTGDERVRFCGRCEKDVYDLSALTAAQAEALLREKGESMCVQFFRRSDGTILTSDCPVGGQRKRFWRRVTTAAVASGLAAAGITLAVGTSMGSMGLSGNEPGEPEAPAEISERFGGGLRLPRSHAEELEILDQRLADARARHAAATRELVTIEQELYNLEAETRGLWQARQYDGDRRLEISDACRKNPLDC